MGKPKLLYIPEFWVGMQLIGETNLGKDMEFGLTCSTDVQGYSVVLCGAYLAITNFAPVCSGNCLRSHAWTCSA